jgi:Mn2+/Fe2+ NRAMP family transporter
MVRAAMAGTGERKGFLLALGPGVLFTGAAVGVSHLVQSTRAGAMFGLGLFGVVILANVVKYPAFRFGPHYAAVTHTSLLEGYRRQGRWALILYGLVTVGTMFTVQAAVTLMTAGLLGALLGIETSAMVLSIVVITVCVAIVSVGRFHVLDRISKVLVSVLAISTVAAAALALPELDFAATSFVPGPEVLRPESLLFVAALIGWMPSAIDIAVWQSLWTLAREEDSGHRPTLRESMFDFHLGYVGTALLALCFVIMGAALIHGREVTLSAAPGAFAAQVVSLYTAALGEWSRPVIAISAFATMFSTTLTVVDGFPRALTVLVDRFRGPEAPGEAGAPIGRGRRTYWATLAVLAAGSIGTIVLLADNLLAMVDVATTLSFLTAPILAWLNHRAVLGPEVPRDGRPTRFLILASAVSIVLLFSFAAYYVFLRFGS